MAGDIQSQKEYQDQIFSDLDLSGQTIKGSEFVDCRFERCAMLETSLMDCRFVRCVFKECDLSLCKLPGCHFDGVRFLQCKLIGINWAIANWEHLALEHRLEYKNCALNHGTFIGLPLKELVMRRSTAVDVDFRQADLSGADFTGTDLADSLFGGTNLTGADLSRARNYRIDPGQNILKGAHFSLPEAMALLYSMDIVLDEPGGEE